MPIRRFKTADNATRIVQEALPIYEPKFHELKAVRTEYGEVSNKWQDGYYGIGWRVVALNSQGRPVEERTNIPRRESRGALKLTRKEIKTQTTTFSTLMQKATMDLCEKHNITTDRVDGDFITPSTVLAEGLNKWEWGGSVLVDDYVLLEEYVRRLTYEMMKGEFDIKIDPKTELSEGRLEIVGVGAGAAVGGAEYQGDPWKPFMADVGKVIYNFGIVRANGESHERSLERALAPHSLSLQELVLL